jgi:hypothetical protein
LGGLFIVVLLTVVDRSEEKTEPSFFSR